MTTPSKTPKKDHGFSSFAFGVAVGVGAALLLGTEEGRRFTSKLIDTLKDNLTPSMPTSNLRSEPESTPHTATYTAPPPSF